MFCFATPNFLIVPLSPYNSAMKTETDIEQIKAELVELQTQVAFQEDTIGELNQALALQQKDLEWVRRQWELLREEFANLQGQAAGANAVVDEKPPHY